jgi:4-hydroxy-4-methyl-2-oxoglutarate aldolase
VSTGQAATALQGLSAASLHESGAQRILPLAISPIDHAWRIAGRAFTVEAAAGHNIWIHRAVYAAQPGDVLVVSTGHGYDYGYWGSILTTAAQQVGLSGLVIDGCVRDSAELVRTGWPVFARGLCVRGTGKDPQAGGSMGAPIDIGGCTIRTGDIVLGDRDGVVLIAEHEVQMASARARTRDANEAHIAVRLRRGETTLAIYGLE